MKILIAEDDSSSRLLLRATLKKLGHEVFDTESGREAWEAYQKGDYRIVISDWNMPDMDGLELCRKIRSHPAGCYTYLLLLTANQGKESYLDAMSSGADDFLNKPFDKQVLSARLHVAQRILNLHDALRVQATHDPGTGLWNRAAILNCLAEELQRAERGKTVVGVALADIDHFKRVNDTYGHLAGDAVLREAAGRLKSVLRPYDRIGRYGGEEFLVVLPGCTSEEAGIVAERMRRCMGGNPVETNQAKIEMTCSIGVSASVKSDTRDLEALIHEADEALYVAKREGRNRVVQSPSRFLPRLSSVGVSDLMSMSAG